MKSLVPLVGAVFLLSNVLRAWTAEWIYPLDQSSLWRQPSDENLMEETRRIQWARRWVPQDPRYAYRLTRTYQKIIARRSSEGPLKELDLLQPIKDFDQAIKSRPIFPEYLIAFALFLYSVSEQGKRSRDFISMGDPLRLADKKVERALYLASQDLTIRGFAASYYLHRGLHHRSLALWRSILAEDPSRTEEVLRICFEYYRDEDFLLEIAPEEKVDRLVQFQNTLLRFRTAGWPEKAYLKTLPLLIEHASREGNRLDLLESIGRTYREAGEYRHASFWYQKALDTAKDVESRASLLLRSVDLLLEQERKAEALALLEKNLDLSSVKTEILSRYEELSRNLSKSAPHDPPFS